MTEGSTTLTFTYDSERSRIKQVSASGTTTYWNDPSSGAKAEKFVGGATTLWKNYVFAGGGIAVIYTQDTLGATYTRYIHKDHLGSTSVVTDETATVLERDAYDSWGRRRYANGTDDDAASTLNTSILQTDKGYTGQEHLEEVALIHMNGRIYDPLVGRFMSADPYIQDPMNGQGYNRYAYVLNNPLAFTDPSGYFGIGSIFKAVTHVFNGVTNAANSALQNQFVRTAVAITAAYYLGPGGNLLGIGNAYAASAVGGFTGGVIAGGDLKSGFIGAATAVAFYGVGDLTDGHLDKNGLINGKTPSDYFGTLPGVENLVGHAVVGCASASVGGGSCGAGAFGAAAGAYAGPVIAGNDVVLGTVVSATVGGTASVLDGGRFENGAMTAAYGYLFNACVIQNSCTLAEKIRAFGDGAASVAKGDVNALRFVARGTGLMGAEEQARWELEGKVVTFAVNEYFSNADVREVTSTIAKFEVDQILHNEDDELRWHMIGRFSTGILLAPAGGIATIGDATRAVENGHNIVESLVRGAVLGKPAP